MRGRGNQYRTRITRESSFQKAEYSTMHFEYQSYENTNTLLVFLEWELWSICTSWLEDRVLQGKNMSRAWASLAWLPLAYTLLFACLCLTFSHVASVTNAPIAFLVEDNYDLCQHCTDISVAAHFCMVPQPCLYLYSSEGLMWLFVGVIVIRWSGLFIFPWRFLASFLITLESCGEVGSYIFPCPPPRECKALTADAYHLVHYNLLVAGSADGNSKMAYTRVSAWPVGWFWHALALFRHWIVRSGEVLNRRLESSERWNNDKCMRALSSTPFS